MHCVLISSTPKLSHATSLCDRPKRICERFDVFLANYGIWLIRAFNIICVCITAFKDSIPHLTEQSLNNTCSLLFLIFSHQKAEIQIFPLFHLYVRPWTYWVMCSFSWTKLRIRALWVLYHKLYLVVKDMIYKTLCMKIKIHFPSKSFPKGIWPKYFIMKLAKPHLCEIIISTSKFDIHD